VCEFFSLFSDVEKQASEKSEEALYVHHKSTENKIFNLFPIFFSATVTAFFPGKWEKNWKANIIASKLNVFSVRLFSLL
jgi:hypothetical protein